MVVLIQITTVISTRAARSTSDCINHLTHGAMYGVKKYNFSKFWRAPATTVRECLCVLRCVPLGTPLREIPAIRTGFQGGTNDDLDGGRHDQGERGPSRAVICRVRVKKEGN